jgi:hypothetical protein
MRMRFFGAFYTCSHFARELLRGVGVLTVTTVETSLLIMMGWSCVGMMLAEGLA